MSGGLKAHAHTYLVKSIFLATCFLKHEFKTMVAKHLPLILTPNFLFSLFYFETTF